MNYMDRQEIAHNALLAAIVQGRKRPSKPLINPVVDRKRSPVASGLVVADLELCSEPGHAQGWVPVRMIWSPRALGSQGPPPAPAPHPQQRHPQQRHPQQSHLQETFLESNVQRQLQLKLQLYNTDSGPSLEPQQAQLTMPPLGPLEAGQAAKNLDAGEAAYRLQRQRTTIAAAAAAGPCAVVRPPKHEEAQEQAQGVGIAQDALRSLCASPYDEPSPDKLTAPLPRSSPAPSPRVFTPLSLANPLFGKDQLAGPSAPQAAARPQGCPFAPPSSGPTDPAHASGPWPPSPSSAHKPDQHHPVLPSHHLPPPSPVPHPLLPSLSATPSAASTLSDSFSAPSPLPTHPSSPLTLPYGPPIPPLFSLPGTPVDTSPPFTPPLPEHRKHRHSPPTHALLPATCAPSPTPRSPPTAACGPQPAPSLGSPPPSPDPSDLFARRSRRKSSFSFNFHMLPVAPTPNPSPPMSPPLASAGAPSPDMHPELLPSLPTPIPSLPSSPALGSAGAVQELSEPSFILQGSQVWVNEPTSPDSAASSSARSAAAGDAKAGKAAEGVPCSPIPSPSLNSSSSNKIKNSSSRHDIQAFPGTTANAGCKDVAGVEGQHLAFAPEKLPVVIFLHATGSNMDSQRSWQEQYAFAGYFTMAIDLRYHGERQGAVPEPTRSTLSPTKPLHTPEKTYQEALLRAWRGSGEHPFLLDNVFDIMCCLDYLAERPEADMSRVGITGVSLGGMHAWLTACADPRIAVTAPINGVQGFGWAIHHNAFKAFVASIPLPFETAAKDMAKPIVDAEVVEAVWKRLLPGMLGGWDAPLSLPLLFPKPFIIVNGALNPRCPMPGVLEAFQAAQHCYIRHFRAAQQAEKAKRKNEERLQAEEDSRQQQSKEKEDEERQAQQPPDPRHMPAKPQRLTVSKIPPGTAALITSETISSLGPRLPISDCEGEAYAAQLHELKQLELEAAAEHASAVEVVNTLCLLYAEPGAGHTETMGMHKAVKEFLDIHLKGPSRRQELSTSTRKHLTSLAT